VCDAAKVILTFSVVCWSKLLSVNRRLVYVKDRTVERELVMFLHVLYLLYVIYCLLSWLLHYISINCWNECVCTFNPSQPTGSRKPEVWLFKESVNV
jgi:hypothetical protein